MGPAGTRTATSLVIGLDGAMLDKMLAADTPHLHRLVEQGVASLSHRYAPASGKGLAPQAKTVSGPVRFRYTGYDDWYWALDQVSATPIA